MIDQALDIWFRRIEKALEADIATYDTVLAISDIGIAMGERVSDRLLNTYPKLLDNFPQLSEANFKHAVQKENEEFERISKFSKVNTFTGVMSEGLDNIYHRNDDMFDWFDWQDLQKFVMVGCGKLPITALHAHDRTARLTIQCVDISREAVDGVLALASVFASGRLAAEKADGAAFDYHGADIVYVANMVRGKDGVIARVLETAGPTAKIIVREPVGLGKLWTEKTRNLATLGIRAARWGRVSRTQSRDHLLVQSHAGTDGSG